MYRFIVILGILFSTAFGQEILDRENEYLQLQVKKQSTEQQLDSLNQSLEIVLKEIDEEKTENKDEGKIVKLMSTAFSMAKEIEKKETQIKSFNSAIVKLEKELNTIYFREMATLEKQLDGNIGKEEKDKLEQELILFAEKRIRVVPLFRSFNFNPEKINMINLADVTDDFEREISLDYLRSALAQVDSNILVITEKKEEFEDNKRLEEKADLFMSDVAESRVLGFYESSTSADAMEGPTDTYNRWGDPPDNGDEWIYVEKNAIANTIDFLSQLEYMGMPPDDRINQYKIATDSPISTEEYLEILKSSREFLSLYRSILLRKIAGK